MNKNKLSPQRKIYIGAMKWLMRICAGLTFGLVLFLIAYILIKGLPGISWSFLSTVPTVIPHNIGILPDILNTVYIVIATIIIVVPLGAGAAVYLSEYAGDKRFVRIIEYAAETLSGIPSIIYGLVGMLFFCEFLKMQTILMLLALLINLAAELAAKYFRRKKEL